MPYVNINTVNEKRARARQEGMCGTCCIRRPSEGRKTCDTCIGTVNRISQRARFGPVWCTDCQTSYGHRHDCPTKPKR